MESASSRFLKMLSVWYFEKLNKRVRVTVTIVFAVVILLFFYSIGESSASEDLGKEKVKYDELVKAIGSTEKELEEKETKLDDKKKELLNTINEITEKEKIIAEAQNFQENKSKLQSEMDDLNGRISSKKNEINTLSSDIDTKKTELSSLTAQIQETGEVPIKIGAGFYNFGKDIPPGRYDLRPQEGQDGNVFVRGLDGMSKVAETFGRDETQSFIFEGLEGEEIEATIPIILVPVK